MYDLDEVDQPDDAVDEVPDFMKPEDPAIEEQESAAAIRPDEAPADEEDR